MLDRNEIGKISYNKKISNFYGLVKKLVVVDLSPEVKLFKDLFRTSILQGLAIVSLLIILFYLSILANYRFWADSNSDPITQSTIQVENSKVEKLLTASDKTPVSNNISKQPQITGGIGGSNNNTELEGRKQAFQDQTAPLKTIVDGMGDTFDSFVFSTIDPTGFSAVDSRGGVEYNAGKVTTSSKITFGGRDILSTSQKYASLFLVTAGGIFTIILVLTGYQIFSQDESSEVFSILTQRIKRILIAGLLVFSIAPTILSGMVIATNLLNKEITSFSSSACNTTTVPNAIAPFSDQNKGFMQCTFNKLKLNLAQRFKSPTSLDTPIVADSDGNFAALNPQKVEIDDWDVGGYIKRIWYVNAGWWQNLPVVLLTFIAIILFAIILIQFVVRFINLYFLFCFYPIVFVFWAFPQTQKICYEYIKQIVTLLLHQPFFLLAFVIFSDLSGSLADFSTLSTLIIYIIFLGALTTMPSTVSARIFGDVGAAFEHLRESRKRNFVANGPKYAINTSRQTFEDGNRFENRLKIDKKFKDNNLNSKSNNQESNVK